MFKPKNENGLKLLIFRPLLILRVVPSGFEPEQTEPKSVVLPLHHGTKPRFEERKGNEQV